MALTRISITIPRDLLVAADRRARALDRSRSWLIVEAVRAYLAASPVQVSEPTSPGLGPQRLAQLEMDLRLTPEQRVRSGEETARLGTRARGAPGAANRLISFDRYEDYVEWKRKEHILP